MTCSDYTTDLIGRLIAAKLVDLRLWIPHSFFTGFDTWLHTRSGVYGTIRCTIHRNSKVSWATEDGTVKYNIWLVIETWTGMMNVWFSVKFFYLHHIAHWVCSWNSSNEFFQWRICPVDQICYIRCRIIQLVKKLRNRQTVSGGEETGDPGRDHHATVMILSIFDLVDYAFLFIVFPSNTRLIHLGRIVLLSSPGSHILQDTSIPSRYSRTYLALSSRPRWSTSVTGVKHADIHSRSCPCLSRFVVQFCSYLPIIVFVDCHCCSLFSSNLFITH